MTPRFDPSARTPQDRDRDRNWDEQLEAWLEFEQQIADRRDEHGDGWLAHLTEAEAMEAMRLMSPLASIPGEEGHMMGDRNGPFLCPLCGRNVSLNTRGVVQEHFKRRDGRPLPEGCEASGHRPSVVASMAEKRAA